MNAQAPGFWVWSLHITFVQVWTKIPFTGSGQDWFAANILWFSIAFPFFDRCLPRRGLCITLATIALLLAARGVVIQHCIPTPPPARLVTPPYWTLWEAYVSPMVRIWEFVVGMCAADIARQIPESLQQRKSWGVIFDGALVAMVISMYVGVSHIQIPFPQDTWKESGVMLSTCVICVAAYCIAVSKNNWGIISRCLTSPLLVGMAKYAYGAYMYQAIILFTGSDVRSLDRWVSTDVQKKLWPFFMTLPWVLAFVSYHHIESPLRRAMDKRLDQWRTVWTNEKLDEETVEAKS